MAKMVSIDDIPVGSKFHGPIEIERISKEDIEKAEKWWKSLPDAQRLKIYRDIQEAIHDHWNEDIEEKEGKKEGSV